MSTTAEPDPVPALRQEIASLAADLEKAELMVRQCDEALDRIGRAAADAEARNEAAGLVGALKGRDLRSTVRRTAERSIMEEERRKAENRVRLLEAELALRQERLRTLAPPPADTATLPRKLKEAYELGLLTEEEYEAKRRKLAGR